MLLLFSPSEPTKEEIIDKARGYGMVFREEVVPLAPVTEKEKGNDSLAQTSNKILVTIPDGASLEKISAILEGKGVIKAAVFEAEVHSQGVEQNLKAGSYYLPKGNVKEIIKLLTK
ncbi:MAG: hypothetical protein PWP31_357 [Clostridia bacterium]|nr:hypothetical protein [Clostridia bacterium]